VGLVTRRVQLALDASAGPASVALFIDGALVQAHRIDRQGSAELLAPTVAAALNGARCTAREITDVIVGAGPGSFTGLRVAAALAKGLARGAGASFYSVPSLPLIAAADTARPSGRYISVLDALRGEWFAQGATRNTNGAWTLDGPVERLLIETVRERALSLGAHIVGPPIAVEQQPDARAALMIGITEVERDAWEPDYGRLAEAQVKWEAANNRALPAS